MFIETKIYKAFSNIINNEVDYSNLKEYLNTQFESFAGNKLNPGKLDVFASRFIGLKGPNVVSFLFEEKIDSAQSLYDYCYSNSRRIFHNLGTLHNESDDYFCFYAPLISFEMSGEDAPVELDLSLVVTVSLVDGNIDVSHTLMLVDEDSGDFHEIPHGWDLSENKAIDLIVDELKLGNVKSKKLCSLAEPLMDFLPEDDFDTLMVIKDISASVASLVSQRINELTGHKMRMQYRKMFSYDEHLLHKYRSDFAIPETKSELIYDDEDNEEDNA